MGHYATTCGGQPLHPIYQLAIGPAALTRKACPGDGVMEQERELVAAIESAKTWSIRDGVLDVHRVDGERGLWANAVAR